MASTASSPKQPPTSRRQGPGPSTSQQLETGSYSKPQTSDKEAKAPPASAKASEYSSKSSAGSKSSKPPPRASTSARTDGFNMFPPSEDGSFSFFWVPGNGGGLFPKRPEGAQFDPSSLKESPQIVELDESAEQEGALSIGLPKEVPASRESDSASAAACQTDTSLAKHNPPK